MLNLASKKHNFMNKLFFLFTLIISILMNSNAQSQTEDPYIWMEEVESERSMDWVLNQNKLTADKLSKVPGFDSMKQEYIDSYNDKDKIVYPDVVGDYMYNFWKDEDHVRGLWRRMSYEDYLANKTEWETVLDLDVLSKKDGKKWVFHGTTWLAPKYEVCLLALSDGGTDEDIVREFNVVTKEFVKGGFELPTSKGSVGWINENELIISRKFGEGSMTTSGYPRIVKRWKRGADIKSATIVTEGPDTLMGIWASSSVIEKERYVFISKSVSFYSHETFLLVDGKLKKMNLPDDSDQSGFYKGQLLLTLNSDWKIDGKEFKTGDLIGVDFKALLKDEIKTTLVFSPDEKSSIDGVSVTKNKMVLNILHNVQSELLACDFNEGKWAISKIEAPKFGKMFVIGTDDKKEGYFYQFSNFITPPTLYYVSRGKERLIKQLNPQFDASNLEVHQYEATSKDGTLIPYFIVHRKDIKFDGTNPTLVYAYGGFNISITPSYSTRTGIGWLEQGGVYVIANIRGGGEFGPDWHHAAMKNKRQNAYDDFYAVCENLIDKKITTPRHMGAFGWSNGGLMAGVVATQRPDLFNAVIIGAPLLDMKRFNKMLAGASWMGEYGNPDIAADWKYIKKFSPYHNVHADKKYPEVLLVTSTKDDRVHPAHARKMAARMIEQGHPIFYYETTEGGHGAASTNEQVAFNETLMFMYLKMKLF